MKKLLKFLQIILFLFNLNCKAQWVALPDRPAVSCNSTSALSYVSQVRPAANNKIVYFSNCQFPHSVVGNVYISNDDLTINDLGFSTSLYTPYGNSGLGNVNALNDSTFSFCLLDNSLPVEYYTQNTFTKTIVSNGGGACGKATAISPNYVYGIPQFGAIFRSNKSGQQTTYSVIPNYTAELDKLTFINGSVGFTLAHFNSNTSKSTLIKITQYGAAWSPILIDSVNALIDYYISDQGTIYVLKKSGAVLKSTDSGATFSALTSAPAGTYTCIHFANGTTGFIGGEGGVLLKTQDGGNTWTSEINNTGNTIRFIYTFNNNASYFVDAGNKIYKSQQVLGLSKEYNNARELSVFPNPASKELTVKYNAGVGNYVRSEITDITGRVMMKSEFQNEMKLDVSGLSNGVYFVRLLEKNGSVVTQKFLITK